ncbi:MAG: MFS family permease [Paracoccaceae bacterium]|jgi:MFS family permease
MLNFLRSNAPWLSAGALLTFISSFGQTFFISIFAGHIKTDFALSDGEWGLIYTSGTAASALVMVWAGSLTDLFRVRALAVVILPLLALACLGMAAAPAAWALPFVIFALRFTGQGMLSHIATVAMARWFVATRGKALSIATLGFAVGESLLPLLFVALMTLFHWQLLWVGAAGVALLALPVVWRLLHAERTPQSVAHSSMTLGMSNMHWTRRQVLRHWLFWLMVPALLGPSAFVTAFFFQQVHLAEVKELSHVAFVALFPLYTLSGIIAMIASGLAIDRFGTATLMPLSLLPLAAGFAVLSQTSGVPGLAAGLMLMGMTIGANATLPAAFWAEFYGSAHLGAIKAMATAIMVLGSAIGPGVTGLLIDAGVDFDQQMLGITVYFVIASAMVGVGISRSRKLLPHAA